MLSPSTSRRCPTLSGRFPKERSHSSRLQPPVLRASLTLHLCDRFLAQVSDITTSLNTAFQALYGAKELELAQRFDSTPAKGADETWVFIYGGSSGVGQFGIQLAKLSGYKVVTVASPRNHQFLRDLGVDAVFDVCIFALLLTLQLWWLMHVCPYLCSTEILT